LASGSGGEIGGRSGGGDSNGNTSSCYSTGSNNGLDSLPVFPRQRSASPPLALRASSGPSVPVMGASHTAELTIYRLTHQALRKVTCEVASGGADPALVMLNTVAVLDVTDQLLKDNRLGTGKAGRGGEVTVSALSDQAREYLSQYDRGLATPGSVDSFQKCIQLAKAAYDSTLVHDMAAHESLDVDQVGLHELLTQSGLERQLPRRSNSSSSFNKGHSANHLAVWGVTGMGSLAGVPLKMFSVVDDWEEFDACAFQQQLAEAQSTAGVLAETLHVIVRRFDMLEDLGVPKENFAKFCDSLEKEYSKPDYHTSVHAADVAQAVAFLLAEGLYDQLTPLQAFAIIVAAAVHDVGHPGFNNAFLIATESNEALRWNDISVNENGHLYTALRLLRQHKVVATFTPENKKTFFALLRRLVLSTDMEKHTELVTDFVAMATDTMAAAADDDESEGEVECATGIGMGRGGSSLRKEGGGGGGGEGKAVRTGSEGMMTTRTGSGMMTARTGSAVGKALSNRSGISSNESQSDNVVGVPVRDWRDPALVLCYVLHCADISNPARPFEVAKAWGERITEEFYKQGDKERELGMRVLTFCDRAQSKGLATMAQNQVNFIDFVCKPSLEGLTTVLPSAADLMLFHIGVNREKYQVIINEQAAKDKAAAARGAGGGGRK